MSGLERSVSQLPLRAYLIVSQIHYWRIPVPELWIDVLEKVKAAG